MKDSPGFIRSRRAAVLLLLALAAGRSVGADEEVEVRRAESVVVSGLRADEKTPVAKKEIEKKEIDARNQGKEIGAFLEETPSITQYSDTGLGNGYNSFSLRGIQQTRINMTFDGVPLNDAEDSAVYTVDYANLVGSVQNLQIQRGVGTSTVGAAAFAGSINFASVDLADRLSADAQLGGGSFGTYRASAGLQTGLFGPGLKLYLRPSWQETNGFRESSDVLQKSLFLGLGRDGETTSFKVSGFIGQERTQMAFLAVEKEVLETNLRYNPLAPEEQDRFTLGLVQAQATRVLSPDDSLSVQGYYHATNGWYRLFADPERTTLWQYGLAWHFFGGAATWTHAMGAATLTVGAHGYGYESTHTRDVVDAGRDYLNHGFKYQASGFAKLGWDTGPWHLYADAQVRWARFRYDGDVGPGSVDWTFFNPKVGARYDLTPGLSVFASVGQTTREPTRGDLLLGEDNATVVHDFEAVKPEKVTDVEAGVDLRTKTLTLSANLYFMEFRNEIALTGELSDVGLPLRRNVDRSYRRGLELDASWQALPWLRANAALNVSRNRIREWTQFYDVYDAEGSWVGSTSLTHADVQPLLTPELVVNLGVDVSPVPWLAVGLRGRHVNRSFLDNTNHDDLVAPSYANLNAGVTVDLSRIVKAGRPRLRLDVNNVLDDRRIFPSGYSYQYYVRDGGAETPFGTAYYYPLATRHVMVTLEVGL